MKHLSIIFTAFAILISTSIFAHPECHSATAFLGINSSSISEKKAEILNYDNVHGSFITNVYTESAAADAGLRPFDYVFGINDLRTSYKENLTCLLQEFEPGEQVTLHFVRDGQIIKKKTKLRDRNTTVKEKKDKTKKAFLGISPSNDHNWDKSGEGIAVRIVKNSSAEAMGLKEGDRITAINGRQMIDWDDVTAMMNMTKVGDNLKVEYVREGKEFATQQIVKSYAETKPDYNNHNHNHNPNYNYNYNYNYNKNSEDCDCAYLGIHTKDINKEKASKMGFDNPYGEYVSKVLPNTAAEKAKLEVFDYIYGIDQYRMGSEQSLRDILQKFKPENKAELQIIRQGKKRSISVVFGSKNDPKTYSKRSECEDPFLGVRKEYNNKDIDGVAIDVVDNSTAEAMGMKNGDVITNINGYKILDWSDLSMAINMNKAGEMIKITFVRNGSNQSLSGKLKSECDTKRHSYYDSEDHNHGKEYEHEIEQVMSDEFVKDMEKMGEEISEAVQEAFSNSNNFNFENDRERRRAEARSDMDLDRVSIDWEELNNDDIETLRNRGEVEMPRDRTLAVNQLKMSPNPNNGMFELSFDLPNQGDTSIRIFNSAGRMIYDYELGGFTGDFQDAIDISQNGAGSYFLIITQGTKALTKKIVLQQS